MQMECILVTQIVMGCRRCTEITGRCINRNRCHTNCVIQQIDTVGGGGGGNSDAVKISVQAMTFNEIILDSVLAIVVDCGCGNGNAVFIVIISENRSMGGCGCQPIRAAANKSGTSSGGGGSSCCCCVLKPIGEAALKRINKILIER